MNTRGPKVKVLISLAVALASVVLWIRNAGGGDAAVLFLADGSVCGVLSSKGQIMLVLTNAKLDDRRAWTVATAHIPVDQVHDLRWLLLDETVSGFRRKMVMGSHWEFAGFNFTARNLDSFDLPGVWHWALAAPHWLFIALGLIIPARELIRNRVRHRRAKRGWCINCGYDLRGSTSEKCSECGWARNPKFESAVATPPAAE